MADDIKHYTPDIDSKHAEGLTREVAEFVLNTPFSALSTELLDLGRKSILDGFGLALSGSVAESGRIVQQYLAGQGVRGEATVIGTDMKVPERFAAFANGVGIHADDYDDTQLAVHKDRVYGLLTHPTAPCLPAALAIAEVNDLSGRDLMLAYQIGVEVETKIAEAISPRHYQHGFHATATCGTFAAAAAAARLRGLDLETTLRALGIAASQSAGLRENFGTMTKPFHAGRSSESGVVAVDFARAGWTATDRILESPRGFFQAHGGGFMLEAIHGKLGNPWTFIEPGVSIKPNPSGSLTHPGMTKMLELILENDIRPEQVERVDVGTNHNMPNALIHHRPTNELQAKFSMEFCMAILLLERRGGLPEFTDEVVNRADVQELIGRVHFGVHPEAEAAGYDKMTTIIDIHLKDGRTISGRADFGKGSPANPMTYDEAADKFRGCAEFARWDSARTERIVEAVRELESIGSVRELTPLLAR
ncbi:MmgE/PrpD family protein [Spiribacter halobius]|uniref:MmgE/PrpD family protein n=1 Tax=Sediminicurvatus halobius TaxID=2182432 RepID=A0A2U2N9H0_9GAMM|nr:MmgE/PrpD family protein [Spiribacter halobius]PWG65831.1 MmgE/PrpD family protein [Spiribacter halobius]UEX77875.1 MmgE/PrpD family protein [Spiribacter halobius]